MATAISRRAFVAGSAAGLTFTFTLGGRWAKALAQGGTFSPNIWVTIATDGTITIVAPAVEMGQGAYTGMPVVIAEELDADWSRVRINHSPLGAGYGNPGFGGAQITGATRKAVDMAINYAKDRVAFGRPIGAFQAIAHICADIVTWVDGAELMSTGDDGFGTPAVITFGPGDFRLQFFPFHTFAANELARGRLALWDPYMYSGHPFQADVQTAVVYPIAFANEWLSRFGFSFTALEWEAVIHFGLAATFTYLLVRLLTGQLENAARPRPLHEMAA